MYNRAVTGSYSWFNNQKNLTSETFVITAWPSAKEVVTTWITPAPLRATDTDKPMMMVIGWASCRLNIFFFKSGYSLSKLTRSSHSWTWFKGFSHAKLVQKLHAIFTPIRDLWEMMLRLGNCLLGKQTNNQDLFLSIGCSKLSLIYAFKCRAVYEKSIKFMKVHWGLNIDGDLWATPFNQCCQYISVPSFFWNFH